MANKVAVEKWLNRLVKHLCSTRTMCIMTNYTLKEKHAICPLFNYCTDRTKHKGEGRR